MRYLLKQIRTDLKRKMVFLGGPRQVGKTTLAKSILEENYPRGRYFNWDFDDDRQAILARKWLANAGLVVFDELHKHPNWKNWIKGLFDTRTEGINYFITGSARLDV